MANRSKYTDDERRSVLGSLVSVGNRILALRNHQRRLEQFKLWRTRVADYLARTHEDVEVRLKLDALRQDISRLENLMDLGRERGVAVIPREQAVFVVYGRNEELRTAVFSFLRSLGLHPLEWPEIIAMNSSPSPYVGNAIEEAFSRVQAVLVLLTPDDDVILKERYRRADDLIEELEISGQPRPNVLFEAGMAFGKYPHRTLLVSVGKVKIASDIVGRHLLRLDDTAGKREQLSQRLIQAGCAVQKGTDWLTEGHLAL